MVTNQSVCYPSEVIMKINSINAVAFSASVNPNFKGLWGVQNKVNEQRDRTDFEEGCEFIERKTVTSSEYYPFADETENQIEAVKEQAFSSSHKNEIQYSKDNTFWAYVLDVYNEHRAKIMPKLSFTEKQFAMYTQAQLDKLNIQKIENELKSLKLTRYLR